MQLFYLSSNCEVTTFRSFIDSNSADAHFPKCTTMICENRHVLNIRFQTIFNSLLYGYNMNFFFLKCISQTFHLTISLHKDFYTCCVHRQSISTWCLISNPFFTGIQCHWTRAEIKSVNWPVFLGETTRDVVTKPPHWIHNKKFIFVGSRVSLNRNTVRIVQCQN